MAKVIYGDDHVFNAMLYQGQERRVRRLVQRQYEEDDYLVGATDSFKRRVEILRDRFEDEDLLHRTEAAVRRIKGVAARDDYRPITDLLDFQQAKSRMRRVIMSNPEIRELFTAQRIEGYHGHYVDDYEGRPTEDIPMYRRITTGFVDVNEEGDTYFTSFIDEELDEDDPDYMESNEQFEAMDTWSNVLKLIRTQDRDPTSTVNNVL